MRVPATSAALLGLVACRTDQTIITPDPHLERMLKQEKVLAYATADQLPHRMAMQAPPDGTLPVTAVPDRAALTTGVVNDRYVDRIPVPVDRGLVDDGRRHFETFCAPCHGILGDGQSIVAEKMALRRPQNLLQATVRAYPPGRVFQAVREGYGLMPSYAVQLSVQDSWAVVAYVQALQLASGAVVAELPPDVQAELHREAP